MNDHDSAREHGMNDHDFPGRPLWAPWRIEYIRGPKPDGCFLCEKAAASNDEDNLVLARGQECFLLLNTYPYNSGHAMVAPVRHVGEFCELRNSEYLEMMQLISRLKRAMDSLLRPDGYNFGLNLGRAAGAGLAEHLHGHLVPRWIGDTNFMPVISHTHVMPEALTETSRLLRQAWDETVA